MSSSMRVSWPGREMTAAIEHGFVGLDVQRVAALAVALLDLDGDVRRGRRFMGSYFPSC
jgi:hypothetical protein